MVPPAPSPMKSTREPRLLALRRVRPLALLDLAEQQVAHRLTWAARPRSQPTPAAPPTGVPQGLGAGVVGVAELRAVRRQRGAAAGHDERVDGRQRQQPVAEHLVAVRLAGHRRATTGPRRASARRVRRALAPRASAGPARTRRARSGTCRRRTSRRARTTPRIGDRSGRAELLHREVGAEVVRDRVEAARVHDPGAGALGGGVVVEVHPVHELGLAGQVDVVGARLGAGGDERLAVLQVGADRGDHDLVRAATSAQPGGVRGVDDEQVELGQRRVDPRQAVAHLSSLSRLRPASAQRSPSGRCAARYSAVSAAGEAGGAEDDEVEVTLAGAAMPPCSHSRVSAAPAVQPEDDGTSLASVTRRTVEAGTGRGRESVDDEAEYADVGGRWGDAGALRRLPRLHPARGRGPGADHAGPLLHRLGQGVERRQPRRLRLPDAPSTACATASAAAGGAERPDRAAAGHRLRRDGTDRRRHRRRRAPGARRPHPAQPRRRGAALLRPAHRAADRRRARRTRRAPSRAGCPARSPSSPPTTTSTSPKEHA